MLVAIDDVQWLDEPSLEAFLFAGRRLGAEGVAMLGSLREGTAVAGMEVPWLEAPAGRAARPTTSRASCSAPRRSERLAPSVTDRLVVTAAGNPLALLEIPRQLSDGQRAGREPLEELLRPGTGVERAFRRALDGLGDATRRGAAGGRHRAHRPDRRDRRRAARDRPRDRRPRPCRGGAPDHDRRRRARLPPPAAALDRLSRRERGRAPWRPRRARRRRAGRAARSAPGTWRPCAVAPDEEVAAALEGGGARRPRPRRPRHGGTRLRPRGAAHPRGRAARAAAARGGDRRDPLGRGRPRVRPARRGGAARDRPTAGRRRPAHDRPRRDAPRLAAGRLRAAGRRGRARPLARPPARRRHVPRGVGLAHDDRRHARAGRDRGARAGAGDVGRSGRRAARHRGDRRGLPGARGRRAGRRAAERRASPTCSRATRSRSSRSSAWPRTRRSGSRSSIARSGSSTA